MPEHFRILLVCTGNVCRSPFAERLIRARLHAALGPDAAAFEVTSAGTRALVGHPMDIRSAAIARALGADTDGFTARRLTAEMVTRADLVLTAEREHRAAVVALSPAAHRYTFTLAEFARIVRSLPGGAVDPGTPPVARAAHLVVAVAARRGAVRPDRPQDDDVPDPVGSGDAAFQRFGAAIVDALAEPLRVVTGMEFPPVDVPVPAGRPILARLTPRWVRRAAHNRPLRLVAFVVAGLSLVVGLGAGWLAVRGWQAAHALRAVDEDVRAWRAAGGTDGDRLADARRHGLRAYQLTNDPLWQAAAAVPYVGNTPRAVRAATAAVRELSLRGLPAAAEAAAQLRPDQLRPAGDRIAVDRIARAGPALDTAAAAVTAATDRLRHFDASWTPGAVVDGVRRLRTDLARAGAELESLRRVVRIAPPMLGVDGPRRYFVAFQNNAEARGTGGLVGMYAVVSADRGRLRVERLGSNTDLVDAATLPVDLGSDFQQLWGDDPALWANSNLDPHFPDAARLWLALWQRQTGQRLDGAIATDPVALGYVLGAVGPLRLSTGDTVDAGNATSLAMRDVYVRYPDDNRRRDAFMRSVAAAAIDALMSDRADPGALAVSLRRAVTERRLFVYSRHSDVERELGRTGLGGGLPAGAGPYAFVVVNNVSASKMDYYLLRSVNYTSRCADGLRRSRIEVTLGNTAPPGARLPGYVTQRQDVAVAARPSATPGAVSLLVSIYGPRDAGVEGATVDGTRLAVSAGAERGRPVWSFRIVVNPGKHRTVRLDVTEPPSDAPPVVPVQPLVLPQRVTTSVTACR